MKFDYIALTPGASYRGLHDSLVNHLGNEHPQMLLCLHEEAAVAIAHGYAKATDRMMAAAVHSNVGLMHGTMAIYNAWCDRVPVIVVGGNDLDAATRPPGVPTFHAAQDINAIIRDYTPEDYEYEPEEGSRAAKKSDYDNVDVIPVSDPNASTMAHKLGFFAFFERFWMMYSEFYAKTRWKQKCHHTSAHNANH